MKKTAASFFLLQYLVSDDHKSASLDFISKKVKQEIMHRLFESNQFNQLRFLSGVTPDDVTGVIWGRVFELFAHRKLSMGGEFTIKCLVEDKIQNPTTLHIPKLKRVFFTNLQSLKPLLDEKVEQYIIPANPKQVGFDAIFSSVQSQKKNIVQFTSAESHKINTKIVTILKVLSPDSDCDIDFYFVLPPHRYNNYKKKKYEEKEKKKAKREWSGAKIISFNTSFS